MSDIASSSSAPREPQLERRVDRELLKAATTGDFSSLKESVDKNGPEFFLGRTPQGNTCLHISSIYGNLEFSTFVEVKCRSAPDYLRYLENLLSYTNLEGETPLLIAVTLGHVALASFLLKIYSGLGLREAIIKRDNEKFNALHHAIRNGHRDLAVELIEAAPELSRALDKEKQVESPMFIAVMRDFTDISVKLLDIADSSFEGSHGRHALHAAARNGNRDIAFRIMQKRPDLARRADKDENTPIRMAVCCNKVGVLQVLLESDDSLGYEVSNQGYTLLTSAATRGHVDAARELLKHCPDAPYRHAHHDELTCLHTAVRNDHAEFVKCILETSQLRKLINMQDSRGKTALHYAIHKCNPLIVEALLSHKDIDTTILDDDGKSAASQLSAITGHEKTLDWKEVHVLMLKADSKDDDISLYNLYKGAKQRETIESRKKRKSLAQKYRSNTSLVAILLATITFTAAFTLPGGYSSDPASLGHPVMSKEIAFRIFLICDVLAMCSAFVVAFICLMGRWEDDKFTTYYISITKKLTWIAYMTTLGAFAAGLYTVLYHDQRFLALWICSVVVLLPGLTTFLGKWPIVRRNYRLGQSWPVLMFDFVLRPSFNSDFNDMV